MSQHLPIEAIKTELLTALTQQTLIVLSAPTGAGKSTVLPLWLLNTAHCQADKKVYLLQPRRVAAKNIACYLAAQLNEPVGKTIGYRLKHETKVSTETKIEVITEGILVNIMQQDPELTACSLIIFDEFHERSLPADIAFAIARDIQFGLRDDLTLLLMSATLAVESLQNSLTNAHFIASQGRSFPVEISYQPPANMHNWQLHAKTVILNALKQQTGSILVFLPSSKDIRFLHQQLTTEISQIFQDTVAVYSLYGDLSLKEQQLAIQPCANNQRKVVLATNIAETSLTIEGITCVIDSGLENVAIFDAGNLADKLKLQQISKASAMQRTGRAGRMMPGECIRLYSEDNFHRRPEQANLAIEQADILPLVIEAAKWGVKQLADLPLLTLPNKELEQQAWQTLQTLNIVDEKNHLTDAGKALSQLSCHPRLANMIVQTKIQANTLAKQHQLNCHQLTTLACLLAAVLEEKELLPKPQAQNNADISARLHYLIKQTKASQADKKVQRIIQHCRQLCQQIGLSFQQHELEHLDLHWLGLLLFFAYPERIAIRRKQQNNAHSQQNYLAANGKGMSLNADDPLAKASALVIANINQMNHQLIIRLAAEINLEQLISLNLTELTWQQVLTYNFKQDKIISEQQQKLGAIVLATKPDNAAINNEQISQLWCQTINKKGLNWLNWQKQDLALLNRLRWLNTFMPDAIQPQFQPNTLLSSLDTWLLPFLHGVTNKPQLDKINLSQALLSILSYQEQRLFTELCPEYYIAPTGKKYRIAYQENQASPTVSVPLPEVYGLRHSPCLGVNTAKEPIPLTLALLSPAGRPIQITQDLAAFWQGSYKEVQKEMKGRYPKHYWPDDPANATPTTKTKRQM